MKIGDIVYLKPCVNNLHRRSFSMDLCERATVTKIGRKYFYITYGDYNHELKMCLEDLREASIYSSDWKVYFSLEDIKAEEDKKKMCTDISSCFTYSLSSLNFDQVKRIHAIATEESL